MGHHEVANHHGYRHVEVEANDAQYHQEQGILFRRPDSAIPCPRSANTKQALIAINQDPPGKAATTFTPSGQPGPKDGKLYKYYAGPLSDGVVVGLVAADGAETLTANFVDVPGLGNGSFAWTELYSGQNGTGVSVSQKLASHDMAVFKVTPLSTLAP